MFDDGDGDGAVDVRTRYVSMSLPGAARGRQRKLASKAGLMPCCGSWA